MLYTWEKAALYIAKANEESSRARSFGQCEASHLISATDGIYFRDKL